MGHPARAGVHEYPGARSLPPDRFALKGRWSVDDESAEAVDRATLTARVHGKSMYLVLGSPSPRASRSSWTASASGP